MLFGKTWEREDILEKSINDNEGADSHKKHKKILNLDAQEFLVNGLNYMDLC